MSADGSSMAIGSVGSFFFLYTLMFLGTSGPAEAKHGMSSLRCSKVMSSNRVCWQAMCKLVSLISKLVMKVTIRVMIEPRIRGLLKE